MPQIEPIEIYYSKKAYGFGLFAVVVIFCVGICMLTIVQNGARDFTPHLFTQYGGIGLLLIALGVLLGYVYQKKLRITAPALIIDDEGLTINNKKQTILSWGKIDRIEVKIINMTGSSYSASTNPTSLLFLF